MRTERKDGVAYLVLPDALFTSATALALSAVLRDLREDRDVRSVVVHLGSSSPSGDLSNVDPDPAFLLAELRVPVIATVDGACRSELLELALSADFRLCSSRSTFSFPISDRGGMPSWGGTQRLPRVVGTPLALELLLLGKEWGAAEAQGARLVSGVADDLDAGVKHVIENLMDKGPLALEYSKEAVRRGMEMPMREALLLEGDFNTLLQSSADREEGLTAFFEKRSAAYTGK